MPEEKSKNKIQYSSITTVISVSLVLFLLGSLGVLFISAKKISDHLKENIGFHVYLNDNAKDQEIEQLHNFLNASNYVKSCHYLSKDSAAAIYKKEVGEDFVQFVGYNPLPSSMEVQLKADYANPDSLVWIKKQVLDFGSVKEFDYQQSLLNLVNKNINRIALVCLILLGILLFIAIALINNTIRLAIYSKRFVIKTMQLIGATSGFIRKPFLVSGVKNGVLSGVIANVILGATIVAVLKKVPDLAQVADTWMILYLFGLILILGILICVLSTFFAVRRYLRLSSDDLHY